MSETPDATRMLEAVRGGETNAADTLLPLVYEELRRLANHFMQHERTDHTLQPTAVVHEAYLRLIDQSRTDWKSRAHFFAVAAEMIRRILIDHARAHDRLKRGGGEKHAPLENATGEVSAEDLSFDLIALNEALDELDTLSTRQRRVVELRFFGGLSVKEAAHVLGVSAATVKADWHFARAWLKRALKP